jgi:uncharacterized protein
MHFNKVKRNPGRGIYEEKWILDILDQSPFLHVGITTEHGPQVIPMAFGREGENIYLHGAISNNLLKSMEEAGSVCLSCTVYDGMVLAKSVFHHSMNYRSVVLMGVPKLLEGDKKKHALEVITEKLCPGRWNEARQPNEEEYKSTRVVEVKIQSAGGKMRSGPPIDDPADSDLAIWSGVIQCQTKYGEIITDSDLEIPKAVKSLSNI